MSIDVELIRAFGLALALNWETKPLVLFGQLGPLYIRIDFGGEQ